MDRRCSRRWFSGSVEGVLAGNGRIQRRSVWEVWERVKGVEGVCERAELAEVETGLSWSDLGPAR